MINLLVIILGYFVGLMILQTMIDIVIFDIPFTVKNRKNHLIKYKNILASSIASLIVFILILTASLYIVWIMGGNIIIYIADMVLACIIKGDYSTKKLFSFYCNKHYNNINEFILFSIVNNKERRLYIENYEELLELFSVYSKC